MDSRGKLQLIDAIYLVYMGVMLSGISAALGWALYMNNALFSAEMSGGLILWVVYIVYAVRKVSK